MVNLVFFSIFIFHCFYITIFMAYSRTLAHQRHILHLVILMCLVIFCFLYEFLAIFLLIFNFHRLAFIWVHQPHLEIWYFSQELAHYTHLKWNKLASSEMKRVKKKIISRSWSKFIYKVVVLYYQKNKIISKYLLFFFGSSDENLFKELPLNKICTKKKFQIV